MKGYLQTDGACRGNPGPSGIGYVIRDASHKIVETGAFFIGESTNNRAEYIALVEGLEAACKLGFTEIEVKLDSEVVVKQINGVYRVKESKLADMHQWAMELFAQFESWQVGWIPRMRNALADKLANDGIDNHLKVGA